MELSCLDKLSFENTKEQTIQHPAFADIEGRNCLFFGDNFSILSSLLKTHKGKIDLIYIDPPFNTKQIFKVSKNRKNSVSQAKDSDVAYSDTMNRAEFLEFLRLRLFLMKELLSDEGSIYLHIDTKVGHYVKIIMDEVFGEENFKNDITRIKSNPKNFSRSAYGNEKDMILFYAKNARKNIWNEIRKPMSPNELAKRFPKTDPSGRRYTTIPLHAPGETNGITGQPWRGMNPPEGRHWRTDPAEFDKLDSMGLIEWSSTGNPRIIRYADEHQGKKIQDIWEFKDPQHPVYPTEKNRAMLELIIRQSSNPDSVVLDCFCGSGSTLSVAQALGRHWIGIDISSIAISTTRERSELQDYLFFDCSE